MCVIVVSDKKVKKDIIEKCWDANPHGAGFSVCDTDRVYYHRGIMKLNDFLKCYDEEVAEGKKHVLHFRIPSKGDRGANMTQPFPIDNDYLIDLKIAMAKNNTISKKNETGYATAALSHNGTISSIGDNKLSDSFYAAYILSKMASKFDYAETLGILSDYSRFAITFPNRVSIVGDFEEYEGMYFSNMYWNIRQSAFRYYDYQGYLKSDDNKEDTDAELSGVGMIYCDKKKSFIYRKYCEDCKVSTEYLCDTSNYCNEY